jgi:fructuronate reductase
VTAPRLCTATQALWAPRVQTPPGYRRDGEPGVVHLGLGAFHRAHQAMVFDQLLASGDARWGVHGVAMTQPALVHALREQDGLYAVRVADHQGSHWAVPGALWRMSVAPTEREAVVRAIAAPATRWLTLTVTEKGYTPALARLLLDGLRQRWQNHLPGLTVASCDNLQANGRQLQALVLAEGMDTGLRDWIESHCAFPCSMVDRIVPATSDAIREAAQQALGVQDPTALGVEAFWEWVIEDRLADPRDAALLAAQGVRVTPEVHVFEDAKLRMLNGSHSAMALIGAVTGRPCIADCIGAPHIRHFVHRLMSHEVAPHLQRRDWQDYRDALIARFANPHLRHSVHQIATDSSLKIALRWVPSIEAQLAGAGSVEHHALAAAVWLRQGLAVDESGRPCAVNDPLADWLQANAAAQREQPEHSLQGLLSRTDLWGQVLPRHALWQARVAHWHRAVLGQGVDRAIEQLLSTPP